MHTSSSFPIQRLFTVAAASWRRGVHLRSELVGRMKFRVTRMNDAAFASEEWGADAEMPPWKGREMPSFAILGLVTLGILTAGILTLSSVFPVFPNLQPVATASASVGTASTQTPTQSTSARIAHSALPPAYAIAVRSEATLTGLRSYLLSGEDEFHAGWAKAVAQLRSEIDRLREASSHWSDGEDLRHLRQFETRIETLLREQGVIAALVHSPNRFPGYRLYREDVEPQLHEAERLCEELLATLLSRSTEANAGTIDILARLRASLRNTSTDIARFVELGTRISPDEMAGRVVEMEEIATLLSEEIRRLPPADGEVARRLHAAVSAMTGPLDKIMILRTQPQWDYARFVFDEKVLP